MNNSGYFETRASLLLKVILWRIISFTVGTIVAYTYIHEIRQTVELSLLLTAVLVVVHFLFERSWYFIRLKRLNKTNE